MGDLRAILVKFLPSHGAVSLALEQSPQPNARRTHPCSGGSQIILAFHDLRHAISTSKTLQRKTVDRLGPDVKLRSSFVAKRTVEQVSFVTSSVLVSHQLTRSFSYGAPARRRDQAGHAARRGERWRGDGDHARRTGGKALASGVAGNPYVLCSPRSSSLTFTDPSHVRVLQLERLASFAASASSARSLERSSQSSSTAERPATQRTPSTTERSRRHSVSRSSSDPSRLPRPSLTLDSYSSISPCDVPQRARADARVRLAHHADSTFGSRR